MRTIASKKSIKNWLQQLHVQKFDHGTRSQQAIIELLHHLTASSFSDPALVKSFFEELLFLKVYPASENIYQQAVSAYSGLLNRVQKNNILLKELANTGLPVTTITGCFSYYLNKKLLTQKGIRVFLDDVGGDTDALMQLLGKGLTDIEQEMLSEEKLSWKKWLALFWGNDKHRQLELIIHQIERSVKGITEREAVFASFKIYTCIEQESFPEINKQLFIHADGLQKHSAENIFKFSKKLIRPVPISHSEKETLVQLAQQTIYRLFKETDPFTYADPAQTVYLVADRGISVALFFMESEKQLALECYCGYLLLKNGVPVGYGGGWILGHQCRFGLNILPAFRGGESALLMIRLMQAFIHQFQIRSFLIEPFQLGKGNAEGIQSAAFWFYYKMGFRPMQPDLKKLAASAIEDKRSTPAALRSAALLKKLSGSIMQLQSTAARQQIFYDINAISNAISHHIGNKYGFNRELAQKKLLKKYGPVKQPVPLSVLLIADMLHEHTVVDPSAFKNLLDLFHKKTKDEKKFVILLAKQRLFFSWLKLLQQHPKGRS